MEKKSGVWLGRDEGERIVNVIFFFFQAEDGIRDIGVTGVQTCALPISWQKFQNPKKLIMGFLSNRQPEESETSPHQ